MKSMRLITLILAAIILVLMASCAIARTVTFERVSEKGDGTKAVETITVTTQTSKMD